MLPFYYYQRSQVYFQIPIVLIILSLQQFHEASYALNFHRKHNCIGLFQYKYDCWLSREPLRSSLFILNPFNVEQLLPRGKISMKLSFGGDKSETTSTKNANYFLQEYDEKSLDSTHSAFNDSLIGIGIPLCVVLSLAAPQVGDRTVIASIASETGDDGFSESISTELISRIESLSLIDNIPIGDMTEAINNVVDGITSSIDDLPIENIIPNEKFISDVELISNKVIDAAVSTDPVDIFSIALGEGLAGLIGALATFLVGTVLMKNISNDHSITTQPPTIIQAETKIEQEEEDYWGDLEESYINTEDFFLAPLSENASVDYEELSWYNTMTKASERRDMVKGLVTEAVADSDYFLTKSAAKNLFLGFGIAPAVAGK